MRYEAEDTNDLAWPITRADCWLLVASAIVMLMGTGALATWCLVNLFSLD